MTERTWFVYSLRSPRGGVVRYIGSTFDLNARLATHVSDARTRGRNYPLHRWIRALSSKGLRPVAEVIETGQGTPLRIARETFWIAEYRSRSSRMLNVADGWQPTVPESSRKRAGEKLKGRIFSNEHRKKISAAKTGKNRPDNAERNRRNGHMLRGKKLRLSETERERRRASIVAAQAARWA